MMLDWDEDNSAMLVVSTMKMVNNQCSKKAEYMISEAHDKAAAAKTVKQSQYEIAFGNALFESFLIVTGMDKECAVGLLNANAAWRPEFASVATEKPITAAKVFETPKATAYEGPAFDIPGVALLPSTIKPAAPKPLEKPDLTAKSRPVLEQAPSKVSRKHAKKNPGGRAIIYHAPDQIPMAPWGLPAVELCEWAWRLIEADDHSKMSMNQLYNCAKILSVLVYAGVVPPNSIIPMGMTNKNFGGKY
ncbi:MAG: hypothetical protein IPP74_13160 [Alphaproteobacteria bacterium]|nr:hypothetical protein [Alphaproteobacteria bacterium]